MTASAVEIEIRRTAIADGMVVTIRLFDRYALRPCLTCVIDGSGHASEVADFSCAASALHAHTHLVGRAGSK